jgi:fucose permease
MGRFNDRHLFGLLFTNFLVYGGVTTLVGATLPLVIREFDWSYLAAGLVFAAGTVGYFTTTFLAGLVIDRTGPRKLLTLGLLLQALGVGCFGILPQVSFNMGALVLVGIGQGSTELATNFSVIQMERSGSSRLMNLMHAAFTIGAVAAPALAAGFIEISGRWRLIYLVMGGLTLLVSAAVQLRGLPFAAPRLSAGSSGASLGLIVREPLLGLIALVILLYVGAEMGISSWVSEYLVKTFAATASAGAIGVSAYWMGILLGRFMTSAFYRGTRPDKALVVFGVLSAVCLLGVIFAGNHTLCVWFFFGTGVGYSAVYPLAMTMTGQAFPLQQGVAIGVVSTGGGLGACVFPFIMSAISNHMGIAAGFWFYLAVTGVMVLTMIGIVLLLPRRSATAEAGDRGGRSLT